MKKHLITLCIFLSLYLQSQQLIPLNEKAYSDSLKNVVNGKTDNHSKATAYFLLSSFYRNTDSLSSKNYLQKAATLGLKNPLNKAKYHYYEGQHFIERNKEKAALSFQKAIKEFSKIKTEEADFYIASSWYNYGVTQKNKEGYPFLVKILVEKSIPQVEKYKDHKTLGQLYSQLAIILTYNAEFAKAFEYNTKAIQLLEKNAPNSPELFFAYLNTASNFCYQAKGDEAKRFLDKAEKLIQPYPESSSNASYYYGKTLYFITKQKNEEALPMIEKGLVYAKKSNQNLLTQMFYLNKYDILRKQNKLNEAKKVLEDILSEKTLIIDVNNRKTFYNQLSSLNEQMGNLPEALIWEKKYSKLSDSLNTENVKLELNKLETKFRTAEKQKEIANLNTEKAQKELEINKKNQYLWLLGFASLFLIILMIAIYFYTKKLSKQKEINHHQKLKEIAQQEELKITKAILEGEEKERERVGKDLHDGLGGMLAGVKINFSTWASQNLEQKNKENFNEILNQLDQSVSELRNISRNLMPESLLKFGLETALKDLCEFYTRNDLHIDFQAIDINSKLSLAIQINIFRIVQEILANAVKHSEAKNILLQCSQSNDIFMITIEDDGRGFDENYHSKTKSMGLHNLRIRVDYLKGKMEINSDNEGTAINIELNTHAIS
ncbi:Histidine kinase-, DNA gyrase B-, and HSP90-like ATPase [Chryseobacterium formosense]|uniref:tetratricopeptide repeat-containing sensor histidine kinase n=1 Tax=Chryseobacterium formosense TaxID=236814 RepID=UPI00068BC67A|nr:sensor histidine kinase [Chryseobacterium formosense]SFT63960.1 Histidine kinase-, DNA gyrase B-, and HSP90-like ATPase [Chryseobacterium formosense]